MTCRLSGYDDELMIPQMLEVVEQVRRGRLLGGRRELGLEAVLVPPLHRRSGRGAQAIEAIPMAAGEPNWDAWLAFHRDLFVEHVTRYADAVHARQAHLPDLLATGCTRSASPTRSPRRSII